MFDYLYCYKFGCLLFDLLGSFGSCNYFWFLSCINNLCKYIWYKEVCIVIFELSVMWMYIIYIGCSLIWEYYFYFN